MSEALIVDRLLFAGHVKGQYDLDRGRKGPEYGPETELETQAARLILEMRNTLKELLPYVESLSKKEHMPPAYYKELKGQQKIVKALIKRSSTTKVVPGLTEVKNTYSSGNRIGTQENVTN